MQFQYVKAAGAAVWVAAMCGAVLLKDFSSFTNWTVFASCALLPPVVMLRYFNPPVQTVPQSIQEVLR